ncbi:MAG: glycosyltransferase family 39 protein, partial [Gammaproteobacteria bacterium]|nr:glycosyltransferase family 39 protein [Gammaproteobacteria bacterium]
YPRLGVPGLIQETAQDVHPPFYYLWNWLWFSFTGADSLFTLRLSSVIPAVLTLALVYRLGRDWFGSPWAGLGASGFLATSGIFIHYARELRMYTLVVMLVVLSWWLLERFAVRGQRRVLVAYAFVLALLAYTYYFAAFVVLIQIVVILVFYRARIRAFALAFGGALLLFAPWLPTVYNQILLEGARAGRPGEIGKFAATDPTTLPAIGHFLTTYTAGQYGLALAVIVMAWLAAHVSSPSASRRRVLIALMWLFGPVVVVFGLNLIIPVYTLRYLLPVIPALGLLVGYALVQQPSSARSGLLLAVVVAGLFSHTAAFLPVRAPHQDLLRVIAANFEAGDRVWYNLSSGAMGSSLQYEMEFHLPHDAPNLTPADFVWSANQDFQDVASTPRVWDVRPYWIDMPAAVLEDLTNGRMITLEQTFDGYTVRLYEAPPQIETPIVFADRLALRPDPYLAETVMPGTVLRVRTWWQALAPLERDYSLGMYLRAAD